MRPTQIGKGDGSWYDLAVRTSNVGYNEISGAPSVPREYVSTGSSTSEYRWRRNGRMFVSGAVAGCAISVVGVIDEAP
jgi:hypothetical protein